MISAPELNVLHHVAKEHPSAANAQKHLDTITSFLSETMPLLEKILAKSTEAPSPLDKASQQLIFAGGKRVRPILTMLFERATGGSGRKSIDLAAAVELIHSAALLHDDVIDEGNERRGKPASRVLWGNLISVLSGDLLLTHALGLIHASGIPGAMEDILETTRHMIHGEVIQLEARNQLDIGIERYFELIRAKTASLFKLSCRCGARAAQAADELVDGCGRFGLHIGTAFQIIDDILDLEGEQNQVGKQLLHDLSEGRVTLPIALALKYDSEPTGLRQLLIESRAGDPTASLAISHHPNIREACRQSRDYAKIESEKGKKILEEFLPNSRELTLLFELASSMIRRTS